MNELGDFLSRLLHDYDETHYNKKQQRNRKRYLVKDLRRCFDTVFLTDKHYTCIRLPVDYLCDMLNLLVDGDLYKQIGGVVSGKELLDVNFKDLSTIDNNEDNQTTAYQIVSTFLMLRIPCIFMCSGFPQKVKISIKSVLEEKTEEDAFLCRKLRSLGYDIDDLKEKIQSGFYDTTDLDDEIAEHLCKYVCRLTKSFLLPFTLDDLSRHIRIQIANTSNADALWTRTNCSSVYIRFRDKAEYKKYIRERKDALYEFYKSNDKLAENLITYVDSGNYRNMLEFYEEHPVF